MFLVGEKMKTSAWFTCLQDLRLIFFKEENKVHKDTCRRQESAQEPSCLISRQWWKDPAGGLFV
jgi:hypothetical protein